MGSVKSPSTHDHVTPHVPSSPAQSYTLARSATRDDAATTPRRTLDAERRRGRRRARDGRRRRSLHDTNRRGHGDVASDGDGFARDVRGEDERVPDAKRPRGKRHRRRARVKRLGNVGGVHVARVSRERGARPRVRERVRHPTRVRRVVRVARVHAQDERRVVERDDGRSRGSGDVERTRRDVQRDKRIREKSRGVDVERRPESPAVRLPRAKDVRRHVQRARSRRGEVRVARRRRGKIGRDEHGPPDEGPRERHPRADVRRVQRRARVTGRARLHLQPRRFGSSRHARGPAERANRRRRMLRLFDDGGRRRRPAREIRDANGKRVRHPRVEMFRRERHDGRLVSERCMCGVEGGRDGVSVRGVRGDGEGVRHRSTAPPRRSRRVDDDAVARSQRVRRGEHRDGTLGAVRRRHRFLARDDVRVSRGVHERAGSNPDDVAGRRRRVRAEIRRQRLRVAPRARRVRPERRDGRRVEKRRTPVRPRSALIGVDVEDDVYVCQRVRDDGGDKTGRGSPRDVEREGRAANRRSPDAHLEPIRARVLDDVGGVERAGRRRGRHGGGVDHVDRVAVAENFKRGVVEKRRRVGGVPVRILRRRRERERLPRDAAVRARARDGHPRRFCRTRGDCDDVSS